MAAMIYVYRNGVEVKNHPLHNQLYSGGGAYIGTVNGYGVRDVASYAKTHKSLGTQVDAGESQEAPVMVKIWYSPTESEWFIFATAEQVKAAGRKLAPYVPNRIGKPQCS